MEIRPITRDEQLLIPGEHILTLTTDELQTIKRSLLFRALVPSSPRSGDHVHTKALDLLAPVTAYLHEYNGDN